MEHEILGFERKHMIGILLFINSMGGECTLMQIYNGLVNNDSIPRKLAVLEGYGLLVQTEDYGRRAMRISLTDKGRIAVSKFLEIEDLLKRSIASFLHGEQCAVHGHHRSPDL